MTEITSTNVLKEWANRIPEVKRWLQHIQAKKTNAWDLYRFCQWAKKTPTELLALKANPASKDAEKLLDDFVADEAAGFKNSVKFRLSTAVKSFFKHNYFDLAKAAGVVQLEKVRPYNKPSKENLRKLWSWALNPRDKSLITFTNSSAIAKETLTKVKWKHLEENWQQQELPCINIPGELLKGHGVGRYKGVRQITFLTPEAKRDLINYKEWLEQQIGRALTSEDNIFWKVRPPYTPLPYEELGKLIWKLKRRAGVPFSWHDARRYVNTVMEQIAISPNWARKIRGRKVRGEEAPYSRPAIEQLRAKYKEAVQLLEFTTDRKAEIPKAVQEKLDALAEEQRRIKREYGIYMRKHVSKPTAEETGETKDCVNGEQCEQEFKQVQEEEIIDYLQEGWSIVKELKSGDVIMQRGSD